MSPTKKYLPFFLLLLHLSSSHTLPPPSTPPPSGACQGLGELPTNAARCAAASTRPDCQPSGYINYLSLFYCTPTPLGHLLLLPWLLLLFYLLATTAARHFCPSLAGLSRALDLPPALAGATLLSLGNGAPDVFSALVSFTRADAHAVGINAVLGGALFVITVVAGVVSISVSPGGIRIDRRSFLRDVSFLLVATSSLALLVLHGKIHLWLALAFTSIYLLYILVVTTVRPVTTPDDDLDRPFLPTTTTPEEKDRITYPRGDCMVAFEKVIWLLELPLDIPRRLTIPDATEERWCKPYAVASATLSPLVLALLYNPDSKAVYLVGGVLGLGLGAIAAATTQGSSPPRRLLFVWLVGGFVMSVTWAYVVAGELVSLLVAVGGIAGVSASVLGLTVLAWGNSVGDLVANVAMARVGGREGAQVAVSGCYAGPVFNTLIGLGLALALAAWRAYPSTYSVPEDPTLFQTLGFLVGGLLWAVAVLAARGMRLGRASGVGLLAIYLCFLCVRFATTVGRSETRPHTYGEMVRMLDSPSCQL